MRKIFVIACVIMLALTVENSVVHAKDNGKGKPNRPPAEADDEVPWGIARISADMVWGRATGKGVKVAILDTGIASHEDLIVMGGINTVGTGTSADYADTHGHGTMIAGMIAALDNQKGIIGIGPEIELYAVRFRAEMGHYQDKDGRRPYLYEAMEWCINEGMQVINMSFGVSEVEVDESGEFVNYWPLHDPEFYYWIHKAAKAGIVMVAAAGSDRDRSIESYSPSHPADPPILANRYVDTYLDYMFPASYTEVIAVSSTGMRTGGKKNDRGDYVASSSHFGPAIDLSAPGVGIKSTHIGGGYGSGSGTSYACAHVAGVAALLVGAGVDNVKARLIVTAEDLGDDGRDDYFGNGLVNADAAVPSPSTAPSLYTLSPEGKLSITWGEIKNR